MTLSANDLSVKINVGNLELYSEKLYRSSGKVKQSRRLVFPFSTKREIGKFQLGVVYENGLDWQDNNFAHASCFCCHSKTTT